MQEKLIEFIILFFFICCCWKNIGRLTIFFDMKIKEIEKKVCLLVEMLYRWNCTIFTRTKKKNLLYVLWLKKTGHKQTKNIMKNNKDISNNKRSRILIGYIVRFQSINSAIRTVLQIAIDPLFVWLKRDLKNNKNLISALP